MLDVQSRRHEEAEEVRVFYVAATRAKDRLICTMSKGSGQPGPFAKFLIDAQAPIRDQSSTLNDATFHTRRKKSVASTADVNRLIASFRARQTEFDAVANDRFFSSPSRLSHETEKILFESDADDTDFFREEAINTGLICHKVLEWEFSGQWPAGVKRGKTAVAEAGRLFDVSPGHESGKRTLNDAHAMLTGFYASEAFAHLKKQKILGSEVPFLYPLNETSAMHGIMDLVYEENGEVVVADYKTSRVSAGTLDSVIARYAAQGAAYQRAVREALGRDAKFELIFLRTNQRVRLTEQKA
jgi:ATP-dependent exoDNAse (exonuclease V) beta subunit